MKKIIYAMLLSVASMMPAQSAEEQALTRVQYWKGQVSKCGNYLWDTTVGSAQALVTNARNNPGAAVDNFIRLSFTCYGAVKGSEAGDDFDYRRHNNLRIQGHGKDSDWHTHELMDQVYWGDVLGALIFGGLGRLVGEGVVKVRQGTTSLLYTWGPWAWKGGRKGTGEALVKAGQAAIAAGDAIKPKDQ